MTYLRGLISFLLLLFLVNPAPLTLQAADQTIAIVGATLIDGSGRAPLRDSVLVLSGDSIRAAGPRNRVKVPADARVIEAAGLVLAAGFIDAHNHSDRGFKNDPSAETQVSQGITTVVIGQRAGFKADLVLFDPNRIIDRATFQEPQLVSTGVERVFVNGVEVWNGKTTGNRPGKALRRLDQ